MMANRKIQSEEEGDTLQRDPGLVLVVEEHILHIAALSPLGVIWGAPSSYTLRSGAARGSWWAVGGGAVFIYENKLQCNPLGQ